MTKVTYFLGAGFSAPWGLPVTSTFLEKSKDIYFSDPKKYPHFQKVFETIRDMSFAKNYYSADLFNIEEILSILEMKESLTSKEAEKWFLKYIIDVITASTPKVERYRDLPETWQHEIFGPTPIQQRFGAFIACLLNLRFIGNKRQHSEAPAFRVRCEKSITPVVYSVITPNYDLLLESFANFFIQNHYGKPDIAFSRSIESTLYPQLAKLHGSVDEGEIVPPTWNKSLHKNIVLEWQFAFKLLSEADHIRIIGYSLPDMDAYVRYLFKAAVLASTNLKSIDVICLDGDSRVKSRYDNFITFPKYRFVNRNIWDYMDAVLQRIQRVPLVAQDYDEIKMEMLEQTHEDFMRRRIP